MIPTRKEYRTMLQGYYDLEIDRVLGKAWEQTASMELMTAYAIVRSAPTKVLKAVIFLLAQTQKREA